MSNQITIISNFDEFFSKLSNCPDYIKGDLTKYNIEFEVEYYDDSSEKIRLLKFTDRPEKDHKDLGLYSNYWIDTECTNLSTGKTTLQTFEWDDYIYNIEQLTYDKDLEQFLNSDQNN